MIPWRWTIAVKYLSWNLVLRHGSCWLYWPDSVRYVQLLDLCTKIKLIWINTLTENKIIFYKDWVRYSAESRNPNPFCIAAKRRLFGCKVIDCTHSNVLECAQSITLQQTRLHEIICCKLFIDISRRALISNNCDFLLGLKNIQATHSLLYTIGGI